MERQKFMRATDIEIEVHDLLGKREELKEGASFDLLINAHAQWFAPDFLKDRMIEIRNMLIRDIDSRIKELTQEFKEL